MNASEPTARMKAQPAAMAGIVDRIISSMGLSRGYYGWLIVSRWSEIVGEHYARHSRAIRFDDGVLHVAVENASWRQQMSLDTENILQIIHSYPYGRVVKSLRLVRGERRTHSNAE